MSCIIGNKFLSPGKVTVAVVVVDNTTTPVVESRKLERVVCPVADR